MSKSKSKSKITLIDYDIGNLLSVARALKHIGADFTLARTAEEIQKAEKLILPGVGAFASCIGELEKRGLSDSIRQVVEQEKPLLGICVGMQMLFEQSEEFGHHAGFGFIDGTVKAIPNKNAQTGAPLKIPHIGWSALTPPTNHPEGWDTPLLKDIPTGAEVYFVHSFAAYPNDHTARAADTYYGGQQISAMVQQGNIYGTQFHPEKSGEIGLKILQNFVRL